VKIYATDLDEDALQQARAGIYAERQVADVGEDMRKKYFEVSGARYAFRRDMRRQIIFGRNDLTRDAPISRVDLLVARNTLMYFNAETQASIIRKFHFALTDPGFLFLGKAEMLLNHSDQFEPVDLRRRLFRKIGASALADVPRMAAAGPNGGTEPATVLEAAALAAGPIAQLVIDKAGRLAAANIRAESLFNLRPRDVGRPFQDLEVSYRPIELRSVIEHVTTDQRPVELTDVVWHRAPGSEPSVYNVGVVPLYRNGDDQVGVGISFLDVTRYRRLRDDLERSNHELERAYEELQSLNEELETTNEELQSTNEELETTNEELQSTNEELETMNEELQSTNDELQSTNDVLRLRSGELDAANGFLGSVMRSLGNAVVVVNDDLRVRVWSPGAEDMWGVRADEAEGMYLSDLDIGLPVGEITPLLRQTLGGNSGEIAVDGMNRRGRPIRMLVQARRLADAENHPQGAILVMNEAATG
jgi:two-component system, chemotaxis family, CheB/CheR fusion protein